MYVQVISKFNIGHKKNSIHYPVEQFFGAINFKLIITSLNIYTFINLGFRKQAKDLWGAPFISHIG